MVKKLKSQFSFEEKKLMSAELLEKIEESAVFKNAKCIMAYWSMEDEVHTHDFLKKWALKKRIILPVVNGNQLELKVFKGVEELMAGQRFGISEPKGPLFDHPEDIELIIVPGVAFDEQNNRMGRGKAYYDQLLKESKAYKMGLCFPFQLFDQVPCDESDVKMDRVVF